MTGAWLGLYEGQAAEGCEPHRQAAERRQRKVPQERNSESCSVKAFFGLPPTIDFTSSPFW